MMTIYLELDSISALVAALMALLVSLGYVRLALWGSGAQGHFAAGLTLVHLAVLLRTIYRDIAPRWVAPNVWPGTVTEGVEVAVILLINVLVALSGYYSLRALLLSIPSEMRGGYTLLTVALYPPWGIASLPKALVARLRETLRTRMTRDRR